MGGERLRLPLGKRVLDIVMASVAVAVLSPVLLAISVAVYATMGRPIIFRQRRAGLHGKPFTIYKFRTMTNTRDESGRLLPDHIRITRLGRFLRSTSLDELPELFNVLRGDMSLVGPRPLRVEYVALYNDEQKRRLDVRPGITGWAQVNGRNAISWERRFELDVWYVRNASLWLDLRILLMTIVKVIKREGIDEQGRVGMTAFSGAASKGQELQ